MECHGHVQEHADKPAEDTAVIDGYSFDFCLVRDPREEMGKAKVDSPLSSYSSKLTFPRWALCCSHYSHPLRSRNSPCHTL